MMQSRPRARFVTFASIAAAAASSALAFACQSEYLTSIADADGSADATDAHPSGLDGSVANPDSGAGETSTTQTGGWGVTPPNDFPAHFGGIVPPTSLDDLSTLCAVNTGSATVAPTYSLCATKNATPVVVSMSPNLVVVDSQNALVLWVSKITISNNVSVTGTRSLAIISTDALVIQSVINASASGATPGPGAVQIGSGANGATISDAFVGGGGGAFGTNGGNGGASDSHMSDGGAGGIAYGADASAFTGGSSGGASNAPNAGPMPCGYGGGGGGAIQISAAGSLIVLAQGAILAQGGGGGGACLDADGTSTSSGGGGGAGGTIYVESGAGFVIEGGLFANGGAGSGASGDNGAAGTNGSDGAEGSMPALGGTGYANGGGGGAGTSEPGNGTASAVGADVFGGGGGGAVGRIWLRTATAPTGAATFSPPPTALSF